MTLTQRSADASMSCCYCCASYIANAVHLACTTYQWSIAFKPNTWRHWRRQVELFGVYVWQSHGTETVWDVWDAKDSFRCVLWAVSLTTVYLQVWSFKWKHSMLWAEF